MRRFWTLICVVLALVAVGFSVRADRKSRALATELVAADARMVAADAAAARMVAADAAADARIAELEQRVIEADTLRLAARVYSDDLVLRGMATAVADGVPTWDFVRTARLPEEE